MCSRISEYAVSEYAVVTAYQAFGWVEEAQVDRHFSHIGDLQGTWPSCAVVHNRAEVESPGRCDAVLAEHCPQTDLHTTQHTGQDVPTSGCTLLFADAVQT